MQIHRAGESGHIPSRHSRFFQEQHHWFFQTREGKAIGPYSNRQDAQKGLDDFIDFITLASPKTLELFYKALQAESLATPT